jgi:regulator of protease activity HflC (stomatin/prohibitin superfamily)
MNLLLTVLVVVVVVGLALSVRVVQQYERGGAVSSRTGGEGPH